MSKEVDHLLRRYGRLPGDPLMRFLKWIAELDALLDRGRNEHDVVACLVREDARRLFFMLEALGRIYRRRFGKPMKRIHRSVRRIEDGLGAIDHAATMLELAKEHDFPEATIVYLDRVHQKERRSVARRLDADGWSLETETVERIAKMLEALNELDWGSDADDRRWLRRSMARQLARLERRELDMGDLEAGPHELRRQLRWFPINLFALATVAVLDSEINPIPEYEPLLRDPLTRSPYNNLPDEDIEPEPMRISRSLFIANSAMVSELGKLKDEGQAIEGLAHACRASDAADSSRRAMEMTLGRLGQDAGALERILARSSEIHDEIHRLGLLRELRDQVAGE